MTPETKKRIRSLAEHVTGGHYEGDTCFFEAVMLTLEEKHSNYEWVKRLSILVSMLQFEVGEEVASGEQA
jgi:IS30 family transposase